MSMPLHQLPIEEIGRLCSQYGVKQLSLFGSALTDSFGPASDIDLLVEFDPKATVGLLKLLRLERELSELTGRKVDLVPKNGLRPKIRDTVLSSAKVLYEA
jgi:uncharacterized protein